MDDSLVNNREEYIDYDSLSDESLSNDSLGNENNAKHKVNRHQNRRGSYSLETSPEMIKSGNKCHLTQPIYVRTDHHSPISDSHKITEISVKTSANKTIMSQSLYERPSSNFGRTNSLLSANARQREEKLRLAREVQEAKQKQKLTVFTESEKMSQNVRRRKEIEYLRRNDENKRKASERQRIFDERKARLQKAEEERRNTLLKKLICPNGKRHSPQSSSAMMTMSCYGGFGSARTQPGNKEVVQSRFLNTRPVSSTGKVIGFGSSTPRPICENTLKSKAENKKISGSILAKCQILARPTLSRMSDKMMTSVISPQISTWTKKTPQRQSSFKDKSSSAKIINKSAMHTSVIESTNKIKPKSTLVHKNVQKSDAQSKGETHRRPNHINKSSDSRSAVVVEGRSSSVLSRKPRLSDEDSSVQGAMPAKSATLPRNKSRTKIDTHLDSDSIEEESVDIRRPSKTPQSILAKGSHYTTGNVKAKVQITEIREVTPRTEISRSNPTKDLSESEYKARLMENRRLVREKREREREDLMKKEREKRHADELMAREVMELEKEKLGRTDDTNLTTSNDDTVEIAADHRDLSRDSQNDEDLHLSNIPEITQTTTEDPPQKPCDPDHEKSQRKMKLDSIMSRIRKPNEESSSEGGVSPRRAMSPEPAELEPETNNCAPLPMFRSSLLQSMMNKGRLTKVTSSNKDVTNEESVVEVIPPPSAHPLCSVRESIEDSECIPSPISFNNDTSCVDGSFIKAVPEVVREDCDGKEDSISHDEHQYERHHISPLKAQAADVVSSSVSSVETEEEEIIKDAFEIDSAYTPINSVI